MGIFFLAKARSMNIMFSITGIANKSKQLQRGGIGPNRTNKSCCFTVIVSKSKYNVRVFARSDVWAFFN